MDSHGGKDRGTPRSQDGRETSETPPRRAYPVSPYSLPPSPGYQSNARDVSCPHLARYQVSGDNVPCVLPTPARMPSTTGAANEYSGLPQATRQSAQAYLPNLLSSNSIGGTQASHTSHLSHAHPGRVPNADSNVAFRSNASSSIERPTAPVSAGPDSPSLDGFRADDPFTFSAEGRRTNGRGFAHFPPFTGLLDIQQGSAQHSWTENPLHGRASTSTFNHSYNAPIDEFLSASSSSRRRHAPSHPRAALTYAEFSSHNPGPPTSTAERRRARLHQRPRRTMPLTQSSDEDGGSESSAERPPAHWQYGHNRMPEGAEDGRVIRSIHVQRPVHASVRKSTKPRRISISSLQSVTVDDLPELERTCPICYNDYGVEGPEGINEAPLRIPKCKHVFGDHCIKTWLNQKGSCPYCRDTPSSSTDGARSSAQHPSDPLSQGYARPPGGMSEAMFHLEHGRSLTTEFLQQQQQQHAAMQRLLLASQSRVHPFPADSEEQERRTRQRLNSHHPLRQASLDEPPNLASTSASTMGTRNADSIPPQFANRTTGFHHSEPLGMGSLLTPTLPWPATAAPAWSSTRSSAGPSLNSPPLGAAQVPRVGMMFGDLRVHHPAWPGPDMPHTGSRGTALSPLQPMQNQAQETERPADDSTRPRTPVGAPFAVRPNSTSVNMSESLNAMNPLLTPPATGSQQPRSANIGGSSSTRRMW